MSYIRAEVSGYSVTVDGHDYPLELYKVFQADPANPSVWAGLNDDARGIGFGSLANFGNDMPSVPSGYTGYGPEDSTAIKAQICIPG